MRLLPVLLTSQVLSYFALGQTYTIKTFAGGGLPTNIAGPTASIGPTSGVAVDSAGNVFIAAAAYAADDLGINCVLRLDAATGLLTVVAGNGTPRFAGDNGPAIGAQLSEPQGVAVDSAGNVYIADSGNQRIRKVSNGVITTVAGNGVFGFSGDNGPATSAQLSNPMGVAVDAAGNLFIADYLNHRIRKVSNGVITTVAGNGTQGFSGDNGSAVSAQLNSPRGVAVDSAGNVYIADNLRIRKVTPGGIITTIAGTGSVGTSPDGGPAINTQIGAAGVAVDSAGNVYIADDYDHRIRKVMNGVITTVAGNGVFGFSGDNGPATSAQLGEPEGIAVDSGGNIFIADVAFGNDRVRKVSNGVITTVAGNGTQGFSGDNGPATSAQLSNPEGVAVDSASNVFIADWFNNRIRKVSNGVITTVAGNGANGFGGDNGPATSAQLQYPAAVAVDSAGNIYIAHLNLVRKVSNGVITTVAGNGTQGFGGDNGPATSAQLNNPGGVAVDSAGNIYIADSGNQRIRKVTVGVITTVAGNGTQGFGGDNGPATSAQLNVPVGIAVDSAGNIYIADQGNYRVRKVSNGVITTVAGNGTQGLGGDNGPATSAQVSLPRGVAVDSAGNVFIADQYNGIVRRVSNGVINTVAGNGTVGFSGDNGPAISAQLDTPVGLAVDSVGDVYIAEDESHRIQVLIPVIPTVTAVSNAASDVLGPVAPGEIVTVYGFGLGPVQLTSFSAVTAGVVGTQLAGTQVFFNGTPAPIIYAWGPAVSAIVPYEINGGSAQVTVTYLGQTSSAITVPVAPSAPGIFVWELLASGKGQALAVNQDGSINSIDTPARIGSVITFYATGEGQTSPIGTDGKVAAAPAPQPVLPVTVTIGGQTIKPQYAGGAPGEIAGVMQINVQIPSGIQSGGAVPIILQVGNASSQSGVTIAVAGN